MQDGADDNIDDLLEGLEGSARTERVALVKWLLEQGVTAEAIRTTNPSLLLATRHLIGDAAFVADQVRTLAAGAQADEVMVLTMAPDAATRRRSYELLAAELAR